jgi:hypothetical protein
MATSGYNARIGDCSTLCLTYIKPEQSLSAPHQQTNLQNMKIIVSETFQSIEKGGTMLIKS